MRKFAVLDIKTRWVLSLHASRELAEARLRAYVTGAIGGTNSAVLAPFLPPGTGALGMIGGLRVKGVAPNCRAKAYYRGPLFAPKVRMTPTKRKVA